MIISFQVFVRPLRGRDLGLYDTESRAHAKTVTGAAGGVPAAVDKSEGSGTDNATEPPVGAVTDPAVIMLEQWQLRF